MGSLLIPMIVLAAVAGGGLLIAFLVLVTTKPQAEVVAARLRAYDGAANMSLEELELRAPFAERIVRPGLTRFAEILAGSTPERKRASLNKLLNMAGRPFALTADEFTASRYGLGVVAFVVTAAIGLLRGSDAWLSLVLAVAGGATGYFLPLIYARSLANDRKRKIIRNLPNALDLLQISVEAGLSFEAAMGRVAEKHTSPLAEEFTRVLQETRLGRPRLEAMEDMVNRSEVEELSSFVQAVIQSEQLGTPIANILRIQADEMRQRRLVRAQMMGARASLKMLLPMVGCIFPTLWVILLGPALLIVMKVFK
jgi:tight adherence protein C